MAKTLIHGYLREFVGIVWVWKKGVTGPQAPTLDIYGATENTAHYY